MIQVILWYYEFDSKVRHFRLHSLLFSSLDFCLSPSFSLSLYIYTSIYLSINLYLSHSTDICISIYQYSSLLVSHISISLPIYLPPYQLSIYPFPRLLLYLQIFVFIFFLPVSPTWPDQEVLPSFAVHSCFLQDPCCGVLAPSMNEWDLAGLGSRRAL